MNILEQYDSVENLEFIAMSNNELSDCIYQIQGLIVDSCDHYEIKMLLAEHLKELLVIQKNRASMFKVSGDKKQ